MLYFHLRRVSFAKSRYAYESSTIPLKVGKKKKKNEILSKTWTQFSADKANLA